MDTQESHKQCRVDDLARSIDCLTEEDFCLLAGITPKTAESWRKRGKGPDYALVGTRYLYRRERRPPAAKSVL